MYVFSLALHISWFHIECFSQFPISYFSFRFVLQISDEVEKLKALKLELGDEQPNRGGNIVLKTAKGARDFQPEQMAIREKVLNKIINVFKVHGAVTIDTPVFELKEVLTGMISFWTLILRNLIWRKNQFILQENMARIQNSFMIWKTKEVKYWPWDTI